MLFVLLLIILSAVRARPGEPVQILQLTTHRPLRTLVESSIRDR